MEHTNEIAIEVLRKEYSDYDVNTWHYDRQYRMIVQALDLQREELVESSIQWEKTEIEHGQYLEEFKNSKSKEEFENECLQKPLIQDEDFTIGNVIETIKKIDESKFKFPGISEIVLIKNHMLPQGTAAMHVCEQDYDYVSKNFKENGK